MFADFVLFTGSLAGIIDLLDVGPGLQHLHSAVVSRTVAAGRQQPAECFYGHFILEKQATFVSEWNEEEYERIVISFSLIHPFGNTEFVVGQSRLCKLAILPVSIPICTTVVIVGYKVVETDIF